jgi:acetyl esterase/lipase
MAQVLWAGGKKQPDLTTLSPQEVRENLDAAADTLQAAVPAGVTTREETVDGPAGPIPVTVYTPAGDDSNRPVTLFFHFGGFVIGSRRICHGFCGLLASRARTVVVNVEYRLAPEHPFPAPVEDAFAAYQWVRNNTDAIGGDATRIAVAGDSAGGMLAAVICQEAKRQGWPMPRCQLLIYPWVVDNSGLPSYDDFADAYPLSAPIMSWFSKHYFRSDEDKRHPWSMPLNESDLSGLSPGIVVTAGYDPLRDEGEAYAKRLKEADVPAYFHCYEHLPHAFTMMGGVVSAAQRAMEEIADELAARLH